MNVAKVKVVLFELAAATGVLAGLFLVFANWNNLPESIAIHFNFLGEPDAYGSKSMLLVLAGIGFFVYTLMSLSSFFPKMINTPWKITDQNREAQISLAMGLIRWLKICCTWLFAYLIYGTIQIAGGQATTLSPFFLPLVLLGILLPIAVYFVRAYRAR